MQRSQAQGRVANNSCPLMRFQFSDNRVISAKSRYVADFPVRIRFAASVLILTDAKIDSIGFVVLMLFQFVNSKAYVFVFDPVVF